MSCCRRSDLVRAMLGRGEEMDALNKLSWGQGGGSSERAERSARRPKDRADLTLVESDGLYLYVRECDWMTDSTRKDMAGVFRVSFVAVWQRIPVESRHGMLAHWHEKGNRSTLKLRSEPEAAIPLIRIVGSMDAEVETLWCGGELNSRASLVIGPEDRLKHVITRAFALVHRFATREHGSLIEELVDDPFEAWEEIQGPDVSEEECQRKWTELTDVFAAEQERAIDSVLTTWGFDSRGTPQSLLGPDTA
jgi:hypothetical protein